MSTTVSISSPRRNRLVAAAAALVAAAAVSVTLAISAGGGDTTQSVPSVGPAPTSTDAASGADQFHHFR
jgi:hypothetical protein